MRTAFIIDGLRTPIGKRGGSLKGIHAVDILGLVIEKLLEYNFKAGLTTDVGDAILNNENAFNLRRYDTNDFPQ